MAPVEPLHLKQIRNQYAGVDRDCFSLEALMEMEKWSPVDLDSDDKITIRSFPQ